MENFEIEKKTLSAEDKPAPAEAPAPMPTIEANAVPVAPTEPATTPTEPIMRPIDLSVHKETMGQAEIPPADGKKKMVIIGAVIGAGILAGVVGFIIWRAMSVPSEDIPMQVEQEGVSGKVLPAVVQTPEEDDISVIEQGLNAFNAADIDAGLQRDLDAVNAAL